MLACVLHACVCPPPAGTLGSRLSRVATAPQAQQSKPSKPQGPGGRGSGAGPARGVHVAVEGGAQLEVRCKVRR